MTTYGFELMCELHGPISVVPVGDAERTLRFFVDEVLPLLTS